MGITGVKRFFNSILRIRALSELKGKYVLVDGNQILYKQCIGRRAKGNEMMRSDGKLTCHIFAILMFTIGLIEKGIIPIYVFDGKSPSEKSDTIDDRYVSKMKALEKCQEIENKDSEEYIRQFKRSFYLAPYQIEECKELLKMMGVVVISALTEADAQLAAISNVRRDEIAGVITEDSDVLVLGGHTILKDFSFRTKYVTELNRYDMLNFLMKKANKIRLLNGLSSIETFTHENFTTFAIIMGTDYKISHMDNHLNVCNMINSEKQEHLFEIYALCDFDIFKMVQYMQNVNMQRNANELFPLYNIPQNYIESVTKIKHLYLNSDVIDPHEISIRLSSPDIAKLQLLCKMCEFDDDLVNAKLAILSSHYKRYSQQPLPDGYAPYKNSFATLQANFSVFKSFFVGNNDKIIKQVRLSMPDIDSYRSMLTVC
jgi:5'-3' exonuclease